MLSKKKEEKIELGNAELQRNFEIEESNPEQKEEN